MLFFGTQLQIQRAGRNKRRTRERARQYSRNGSLLTDPIRREMPATDRMLRANRCTAPQLPETLPLARPDKALQTESARRRQSISAAQEVGISLGRQSSKG